jgi:transcriptional antiterminator
MIKKINNRLKRRKRVSSRKLAQGLNVSRASVRYVLTDDLGLRLYKIRIVPLMTEAQKDKRKKFAIDQNKFQKRRHYKSCFLTKKCLILIEYTMLKMIVCRL